MCDVIHKGYCHISADYSATWASPANIQILASPSEVYEAPGTTNATVEVVYKSPSQGRIVVNLKNANEDILIHIDARFKWYSSINTLILKSKKADGGWQQEVRPEGFPFPCCGYITTIILQVEIGDSAFVISANGMEIASYPYRVGLEPPVDVIEYIPGESQASIRAQLQSISVYY